MALAAVLSAMREIILDEPEIPSETVARAKFYKDRFPALNNDEIEDLSKVDPNRWRVYTNSIFVGEKNLIANNFPFTVKLLESHWSAESEQPFNLFRLAKQLHKVKPWKSTTTVALGRNFVNYIKEVLLKLQGRVPYIVDVAEMELIVRKVRKLPDDDFDSSASIGLQDFQKLTIEQVLALEYIVPSYVACQQFSYDVLEARNQFAEQAQELPEQVKKCDTFGILGRNSAGYPCWIKTGPAVFDFFSKISRKTKHCMADLAEIIVTSADQGLSEEQQLVLFLTAASELLVGGSLIGFCPKDQN